MTSPGVDLAREQSIQGQAHLPPDRDLGSFAFWSFGRRRDTILDADYPSPRYDAKLREFVYQEGNDFIQGVNASVGTRMSGFSWSIDGKRGASHFQDVLQEADLGLGWFDFMEKISQDFVTTNMGMVVEIIGPGDLDGPLEGPVTGIAHLDAARCWPTGNLDYPVLYNDAVDGQWHRMHWTRVYHQSDFPSADVNHRGYGWCAVSRVLAAANILIELSKYKKEKLDDGPPPGILSLGNITYQQFEKARDEYEHERRNSGYEFWSPLMPLFSFDPRQPITTNLVEFSSLPDWFNQREEYEVFVRLVANSYGLDVQDIWTLGGVPLGTATQSEVLHQKARGKLIRKLIKITERFVNQRVLPENLTFTIEAQDIQEEQDQADVEGKYIDNVSKLVSIGLAKEAGLRILVEKGVLDEEDLQVEEATEVADDIQQEPEEVGGPEGDIAIEEEDNEEAAPAEETTKGLKAGPSIETLRNRYFAALRDLTKTAIAGLLSRRATYNRRFRAFIRDYFQAAWLKGFTDGGVAVNNLNELEKGERARIAEIIKRQNSYLNSMSNTLYQDIRAMPSASAANQRLTWRAWSGRIELWANSLREAYNEALALAQGNQMLEWVIGPTEEHCRSCSAANGQCHRAKEWLKAGVMPQNENLECAGFRCKCKLIPTTERARGRLSRIPLGRKQYGKALRLIIEEVKDAAFSRILKSPIWR